MKTDVKRILEFPTLAPSKNVSPTGVSLGDDVLVGVSVGLDVRVRD